VRTPSLAGIATGAAASIVLTAPVAHIAELEP
jgi:hypothetical protein